MEEIVRIQQRKELSERHHPVLSLYLMSIPGRLFKVDNIKGGVIVNMIFGVLIIAFIVKICYNFSKSSLLMFYAGTIAASNNNLIYYSTQLLRENSFLFFVCAAVEMLTRKETESLFKTFFLGIITTCAVLCRLEGLEIIMVYTLFKTTTFLFNKHKNSKMLRRIILNYVFYLVFMALGFYFADRVSYDGLHLEGLGSLPALWK